VEVLVEVNGRMKWEKGVRRISRGDMMVAMARVNSTDQAILDHGYARRGLLSGLERCGDRRKSDEVESWVRSFEVWGKLHGRRLPSRVRRLGYHIHIATRNTRNTLSVHLNINIVQHLHR
jgi:hypothetical protein